MDPTDREMRESGLRAAVLAGDERAWESWYQESYDGLFAYISWRCGGDRELAGDTVQETWLIAVKRIKNFDPKRGSFATWLRGIAANVLRNQFRSANRRNGQHQSLASDPVDPGAAPNNLKECDRAHQVAWSLSQLPERYEAVLRAKYLDGQSVLDIAAEWRETPKAIESLLTRARHALRDAIERKE
jgi:RNA polymerase sigma-70 factor (ECF subfamily)